MLNNIFVTIFLASFALVSTVNARTYKAGNVPAARTAQANTASAGQAEGVAAVTERRVEELVNQAIARLPKAPTTEELAKAVKNELPEPPSHDGWHYGLSFGILLVIAILALRGRVGFLGRIFPVLIACVAISASLSAATFNPHYVEQSAEKASVKMCGVGKPTKVEFVAPGEKTASADVKAEVGDVKGGCVELKMTVDDKATTGKYTLLVDGKSVPGFIYVVPDNASVEAAKVAINSGTDQHVRLVLEGMACGTNIDCISQFRKEAWGNGNGTSAKAGETIRRSIKSDVFADDRYTKLAGAMSALETAMTELKNANGGGVTEERVAEIAQQTFDSKIGPVTATIGEVQKVADGAKVEAGRSLALARGNTTVLQGLTKAAADGKKPDKKLAVLWQSQLACELAKADGKPCVATTSVVAPAKKKK